jgi:hypothetical protein|mmetsp:Transcript_17010/g.29545  ORF Transcript_17010/g.29545 Transcript_17010/m.29545 type:complete len:135 (+) Transcript_17010:328-732(+)
MFLPGDTTIDDEDGFKAVLRGIQVLDISASDYRLLHEDKPGAIFESIDDTGVPELHAIIQRVHDQFQNQQAQNLERLHKFVRACVVAHTEDARQQFNQGVAMDVQRALLERVERLLQDINPDLFRHMSTDAALP